ncbi:MAG TPA: type II secretion system F family protein [Solirubrobacteraceae bacterium]
MSRALLLAVGAAVLAATAIVELAAAGARGRAGGPARRRAGRRASEPARTGDRAAGPALAGRPVPPAVARLGRRLGVPAAPDDLARRLEAAGAPPGLAVEEVMALKCGGALAAGLVALLAVAILPGRLGAIALVAAPAGGFLAPDAWLARRAGRRRAAIATELADVLDLLHVACCAGLSPVRALAEVGRRRGGVLARELRTAATQASLGVPLSQALDRLARRCSSDGVSALVAAIGRTERHGAPLGPALRALATDARARQAQRTRERAARASPKIQLVVALLLVPSVMLLVGASLAAALL